MKQNYPWNALLLTKQTLFRGAIAKSIAQDSRFRLVAETDDAALANEIAFHHTLDLLIIEMDWRRSDEFDLIRAVRKKNSHLRILAVIDHDDAFTFARLDEIGVHGCISKNESIEFFEEAIVEVASGGTYFPAAYQEHIQKLRADPQAFSKILSTCEQEVLWHVATGLTSRSIAARLNIGLRSVETYRYRMMKKLEVKNAAGLVEYALRHGLVRQD